MHADKMFVIKDETSKIAEAEEVHTLWSGLCTKINIKSKLFPQIGNRVSLVFHESLPETDIPEVNVYISSEENSGNV